MSTTTLETRRPATRLALVGRLAYALLLAGICGTALTGLVAMISWGGPMTGWPLMLHCTAAPAFAIGLTVIALLWADRCRFNGDGSAFSAVQKVLFWVLLLSGLVVILSATLPMLPLFGTHGQEVLYETHRFSSLVLVAAAVLHAFGFARSR